MSLIYNATFDSQTRILSLLDKAGNVISSCEVPSKNVDDITKPLTFRATQDGSTITLAGSGSPSGSFQTSRDGGNTWIDYSPNTTITLNTGDEVSFRAKSNRTSAQNVSNYFYFKMEGEIEAWHNAMSMYRTNDFATYNATVVYAFYAMFRRCTSLTKAPVLTATTLVQCCYNSMFHGCTSLVNAPVLPATTLAEDCYYGMFRDCTSLVNTPVLPATTLAKGCYNYMFTDCTSLVNAPVLPATTLSARCYYYMFAGCTSLTKAPVLTATTLAQYCYAYMFRGCSSLNEVRCYMSSSYSSSDVASYADTWLSNVSSTGTFYTNEDAKWTTNSASGIPSGWRRVSEGAPAVDDPNKPLMLRAIEDNSSVALEMVGTLSNTYQTSTDGTYWTDYTLGTQISLNKGKSVYFRCSDHPMTQSNSKYVQFVMTGKVEAWHNVMSMIRQSFTNTGASAGAYGMCRLFLNCKSLTKAPVLPATELSRECYEDMFYNCQSLTKAPELPATILVYGCYSGMFSGCQSLTKAPVLPATIALADYCYRQMFSGCRSLKEVRVSATTTATDSLLNWLYDVSATGDFYCDPNSTIFPTGMSGIPQNWTRRALSDYPATP